MRARQRHLNPRDAGANIALDARFITGLSNNDAVTTWPTRTNNSRDATQTTAARKPTYLTAQQGGNPVVDFNNDGMTESTGVNGSTANLTTLVCLKSFAYNGTAGGGALVSCGTSSTQDYLIGRTSSIYLDQANNGVDGSATSSVVNGVQIQTHVYDGGETGNANRFKFFYTGTQKTMTFDYTVPATINPSGGYAIGNYSVAAAGDNNWWLVGGMCSISIYKLSLSNALRRRLESAAATSFKIAYP